MIRRLLRWLAKREIAAALELQRACYQSAFSEAVATSYLRGHVDGMRDALSQFEGGKRAQRAGVSLEAWAKRMVH